MHQLQNTNVNTTGRRDDYRRVEKVVEALATISNRGENLAEVAHDARNMVTALGIYCDLLEEPGVLSTPFSHYAQELRLVTAASRRLVEKLVSIGAHPAQPQGFPAEQSDVRAMEPGQSAGNDIAFRAPSDSRAELERTQPENGISQRAGLGHDLVQGSSRAAKSAWRSDLLPARPIANLAAELLANRNLLSALAGSSHAVTIDAQGGAQPVRLTTEDLTRVLVNLVKNASEVTPNGGRIHLSLAELPAAKGTLQTLTLAVEDNGPGIDDELLDRIFAPGFTTHGTTGDGTGNLLWAHRGLGLSITRSIIEAAGGRITASNRTQGGARFKIELPVRKSPFQQHAYR